jgi:hypothetical protein
MESFGFGNASLRLVYSGMVITSWSSLVWLFGTLVQLFGALVLLRRLRALGTVLWVRRSEGMHFGG